MEGKTSPKMKGDLIMRIYKATVQAVVDNEVVYTGNNLGCAIAKNNTKRHALINAINVLNEEMDFQGYKNYAVVCKDIVPVNI